MISLDEILQNAHSVGIAGHVKPDGDAYGSCMGLYLFLKEYYPQIEARVFLEDSYSDSFRFIRCSDEIDWGRPLITSGRLHCRSSSIIMYQTADSE